MSAVFALLGWASLVLLPTRVLAACPMDEAPSRVPAAAGAAVDGDEHAHHVEHGEESGVSAPSEAGQPDGTDHHAPAHRSCPDIAHCAVAALAAGAMQPMSGGDSPRSDLRLEPTAPPAPAIAIDTPPPRG